MCAACVGYAVRLAHVVCLAHAVSFAHVICLIHHVVCLAHVVYLTRMKEDELAREFTCKLVVR